MDPCGQIIETLITPSEVYVVVVCFFSTLMIVSLFFASLPRSPIHRIIGPTSCSFFSYTGVPGGACRAGQYCPPSSSEALACPGGKYCASSDGTITGECNAGSFCNQACSVDVTSMGMKCILTSKFAPPYLFSMGQSSDCDVLRISKL